MWGGEVTSWNRMGRNDTGRVGPVGSGQSKVFDALVGCDLGREQVRGRRQASLAELEENAAVTIPV
jgi:hypothetical protein